MWGKRWGIGRRNFVSVLVGLIPAVLLHHFLVDFPYQVLGLPVLEQNSCWGMALSCGSVWRKTKLTVPPGSVGDGGTLSWLPVACAQHVPLPSVWASCLPSQQSLFTVGEKHVWLLGCSCGTDCCWDGIQLPMAPMEKSFPRVSEGGRSGLLSSLPCANGSPSLSECTKQTMRGFWIYYGDMCCPSASSQWLC